MKFEGQDSRSQEENLPFPAIVAVDCLKVKIEYEKMHAITTLCRFKCSVAEVRAVADCFSFCVLCGRCDLE